MLATPINVLVLMVSLESDVKVCTCFIKLMSFVLQQYLLLNQYFLKSHERYKASVICVKTITFKTSRIKDMATMPVEALLSVNYGGIAPLTPTLACFVLYLKIINIFLKNDICIL